MNSYERETLQIFEGKEEQFPMICRHIEEGTPVMQAIGQAGGNSAPVFEVIWAGPEDENNVRVICQMTNVDGSMVNSYLAKVLDKNEKEVDRANFVNFGCNTVFAKLTVPKDIFKECSVYMEMARIATTPVRSSFGSFPLKDFAIEDSEIKYYITTPKIERKIRDDRIKISYYAFSSKTDYDYIYGGRYSDPYRRAQGHMYFPSEGSVVINNIKLEDARATLKINGGKGYIMYPGNPKITVSDSDIHYKFDPQWSNTKLSDCFDLNRSNAEALYALQIRALKEKSGDTISIIITNDEAILDGETAANMKRIEPIDVYLDCLAKGTQISMADGTTKPIENICRGDLVRVKDGGSASVREVTMHKECQVVSLILGSGSELALTGGHAVYTKDGIYPVSRLKVGQKVFTENGTDVIDKILPYCERTYDVYSLHLDGGEWLFANGMMVYGSDNPLLFSDRDWVREDLPKEWLTDYDNALKAGILYGKQQ